MKGPAKYGNHAIVSQRGLPFQFSDKTNTQTLLTIEPSNSKELPILIEFDIVVETAFDGGATLNINKIAEDGTVTPNVVVGTMTAGAVTTKKVLAYKRDKFQVVFTAGANATAGRGAAFFRFAGPGTGGAKAQ